MKKLFVLFLWILSGTATSAEYVATELRTVESMLDVARVTASDVVYDLGSGDGRIVFAAANRGANAVGIEIDPFWFDQSVKNVKAQKLVRFIKGDFFREPLPFASVVTLFLPDNLLAKLVLKLKRLTPGTRIVSNGSQIGDWQADKVIDIGQGLCNSNGCFAAPLYFYEVRR
jgi:SAM-dependent methyltransferase